VTCLSEVSSRERWLVAFLANLISSLATPTRPDEEPDWFGHAHAVLVDRLFRALRNGDEDLVAHIFPLFFSATLAARERVAMEVVQQDPTRLIAFVSEPYVDLLEVSGYALLFSELDGKNFWDTCRRTWEDYLNEKEEHAQLVQQLAAVLSARDKLLIAFIKPRDTERIERKQRFEQDLRSKGIVEERWYYQGDDDDGASPPAHPSPIIRVFAPTHDLPALFSDPEDLFVVEYLSKRREWQSELPRGARSIADRIEVERGDQSE